MYRTILTHLSSSRSASVVSEIGTYFAEKHGAHLVGVHNSRHMTPDVEGPPPVAPEQKGFPLQQAEAIQQIFEKAARARKLSFEWHHKELSDSDSSTDIVAQALSADLVIAGGRSFSEALGHWYNLPVRIVMEAGRPVLLVPGDAQHASIGKRITVAWNRTRESTRAVFDALPLLKAAESVRLLAINGVANGALGPDDGLPAALERHGVRVQAVATETAETPAEELLNDLAGNQSDLLVMGCYGRPRLLEMVLGGMTRHILGHVQVPVLLAH